MGSPGWLLVVWLITGFITLAGAISYGELASMFPKVGGQYVYLREAYKRLVAFLYGWSLFLVIQTGVIAAVAVAFARFTGVLVPWFSEQRILFSVLGFQFSTVQLLAVLMLVGLTSVNSRGRTRRQADFQRVGHYQAGGPGLADFVWLGAGYQPGSR